MIGKGPANMSEDEKTSTVPVLLGLLNKGWIIKSVPTVVLTRNPNEQMIVKLENWNEIVQAAKFKQFFTNSKVHTIVAYIKDATKVTENDLDK
jgi:hypothetical protein